MVVVEGLMESLAHVVKIVDVVTGVAVETAVNITGQAAAEFAYHRI